MARHPRWARRLLGRAGLAAVAAAVRRAERATRGEVRVHLERRLPGDAADVFARARDVFEQLGMHRTSERAGVLVYVAVEHRQLAVLGDAGIHARVGDAGWAGVRDRLVAGLAAGRADAALAAAVDEIGTELARHFPSGGGGPNELPDEISLG